MVKPATVRPRSATLALAATAPIVTAFNPMADDNPCYALVGLIAAEQARVEYLLDAIIWNLSGVEPALSALITGHLRGLPARYSAIETLMRRRRMYSAYADRLTRQLRESHDLVAARNRAIHDPWFEDSKIGGSYQHRSPTKKSPAFGTVPVTGDDLRHTLSAFRALRDRVLNLRNDVWSATIP